MTVNHPPEPAREAAYAELPQLRSVSQNAAGRRARGRVRVGRTELRTAAVLVVGLAVLGLVVGLVWAEVAPRVMFTVVRKGLATENNAESESLFAADGWFALIGAGVGLVTGVLAWSRRAARGPFLVLAVLVASFACAVVAWRFGVWIGRHPTAGQRRQDFAVVGHTLRSPLTLRAKGALFFQPFAAVLAVVVCSALSGERRHSEHQVRRDPPPPAA